MLSIDRILRRIVSNLWFEWNSDVHSLFRGISPYVWGLFRRNLYRFMKLQAENPSLYHRRLAEILADREFMSLFNKVEHDFARYIHPHETHVSRHYPELVNRTIAYFSMEYGIDTLRLYSGGLGILSGDHLRGASDLGLSMVGLGLFYLHGYYEQVVGIDGQMKVVYDPLVPSNQHVKDYLPLETVKHYESGHELIVEVPMDQRIVKASVWRARIGRCQLLLLDSNRTENRVHDRHITKRLYASQKHYEEERRRRLEQELLLGIGGVRALTGAGIKPSIYHLNEGHVAFAAIELIRERMQQEGGSFDEARKKIAETMGFTTHTPVPEGNENFDEKLVREYLQSYLDSFLKHSEREILFNCARNRHDQFDMTKLALLLSGVYRNGVSRIHGEVCRHMWAYAWGYHDSHQTPIDSITNAVHVPYWQKPKLRQAIEHVGGIEHVSEIDDDTIWNLHLEFKNKLIEKVRERFAFHLLHEKFDAAVIYEKTNDLLDLDSFMIGFARRFAGYKRITLLVDDEERLFQFLESAHKKYGKPIHILYAGKPHPNNYHGRHQITQIVQVGKRLSERARERGFRAQIVFIEGYDIDIARYLEGGVDVWLNNPIRPLEASGTSGMKAGMNGVLNISIPDGWVPEGIVHGQNGWLFGRGDEASTDHDRGELFKLLEETVVPLYFERPDPTKPFSPRWIAMMKYSIRTITEKFNAHRMLCEYAEKMYLPAIRGPKNTV
jgi:starch phosphorylase